MISAINKLWSMMTVFFTETVFSDDLFLAMIILLTIFGTIYIFSWFFDRTNWGW